MYDKEKCGERLKYLRKINGKTQKEVAEAVNISTDTIRKIEQGRRCPSVAVVYLLGKYYNTTTDFIIAGDTEQQKTTKSPVIVSKDKEAVLEHIIEELRKLIS